LFSTLIESVNILNYWKVSRHSTTWAISPVHFVLLILEMVLVNCAWAGLELGFS
jgi:hypothetical protein